MSEPWFKVYFCTGCDRELTYDEMMGSRGCCPLCGSKRNGTVVNCEEKACRRVWVRKPHWLLRLIRWDKGEWKWEYK